MTRPQRDAARILVWLSVGLLVSVVLGTSLHLAVGFVAGAATALFFVVAGDG